MTTTIMHQYPQQFTPELVRRLKVSAENIARNGVAYDATLGCMYQKAEGVMCIVGGCIDPDKYMEDMEFTGPSMPEVTSAIEDTLNIRLTVDDKWLLLLVQTAHDEAARDTVEKSGFPVQPHGLFAEKFTHALRYPEYLERDVTGVRYHIHITTHVKKVMEKIARAFEVAL